MFFEWSVALFHKTAIPRAPFEVIAAAECLNFNLKMTDTREGNSKTAGTGEASFHRLQPERDLQLNWEVDLAQKLENYLVQICSGGELQSGEDENQVSVNFAEGKLH